MSEPDHVSGGMTTFARQPSEIALRLVSGLAVVGVLVWLALSPRADARWATLERLVSSGAIGDVPREDHALFVDLVTKTIGAAEVTNRIIVNGTPSRGALHFYLTDSRTRDFTLCADGNAIYDGELDAVFVDQRLFRPTELGSIGGEPLFPFMRRREFAFTRTFLTLVLLHELGHRALHRSHGLSFDSIGSSEGRKRELEADAFALEALRRGYVDGELGADPTVAAEVSWAGLGDQLNRKEALTAALLFAAAQMSTGLLFTRGSISSLYEDASHPSYGVRVGRLAETLAAQVSGSTTFERYIGFFRAKVAQVESLRRLGLVELDSEKPIVGLAFDDSGLVVVSRDWTIGRVRMKHMAEAAAAKRKSLAPSVIGRAPVQSERSYLAGIWAVRNGGVWLLSSSGELFSVGGQAIKRELGLNYQPDSLERIVSDPEPAEIVLLDHGSALAILRGRDVVFTWSWETALAAARAAAVKEPRARGISLTRRAAYIAIHEGGGPLVGVLEMAMAAPFSARFERLNTRGDIDRFGELVVVENDGRLHFVLSGKTDLHAPVSVWELDQTKAPALRATYSPLLDALSSLPFSGQNVPVVVRDVRSGAPYVFISLLADAVLRYDVRSHTVEPVFQGAPRISIAVGRGGAVAFSALNGYKAFILPPPDQLGTAKLYRR